MDGRFGSRLKPLDETSSNPMRRPARYPNITKIRTPWGDASELPAVPRTLDPDRYKKVVASYLARRS